jgi:hypothetical protein
MTNIDKRLSALERDTTKNAKANAGEAPVAWARLAQWAIIMHDVGGWDDGWRRIKERGWYPENYPEQYTGNGTGAVEPQWDQDRFRQRGHGKPWFTMEQKYDSLWMIYQYVEYMLEQGVPRAEIVRWDVGSQVWNAMFAGQQGTHDNAHASYPPSSIPA